VGCSGRMNASAQDIRDVGNVWVEFLRQRDVLSLRKGNAQAARCTGEITVNGRDRILSHHNLKNQSNPCFHSFAVSSEVRESLY
jgi:hypothetical protein